MQQRKSTAPVPRLTLYYSPYACSLASHIVLEESRLSYEAVSVDIRAGDNVRPDYLKISPGGMVPALGIGDAVLTESQAILTYIADLVPESGLIPRAGTIERARAHEWMNWLSSSLHVTYRSAFRPRTYAGEDPVAIAAVQELARKKLAAHLSELEARLGGAPYALGAEFSVVDAYLFVFYLWSFDARLEIELPARPIYGALAARVWARKAVQTTVARERRIRAYDLPSEFARAMAG
jgi:glutathione S-transferase